MGVRAGAERRPPVQAKARQPLYNSGRRKVQQRQRAQCARAARVRAAARREIKSAPSCRRAQAVASLPGHA